MTKRQTRQTEIVNESLLLLRNVHDPFSYPLQSAKDVVFGKKQETKWVSASDCAFFYYFYRNTIQYSLPLASWDATMCQRYLSHSTPHYHRVDRELRLLILLITMIQHCCVGANI